MYFKIDSQLLDALFDLLTAKGVRFLVLRNHDGLPESTNAKDVDILILPNVQFQAIKELVFEVADRLESKVVWVNNLDYLAGFVLARQGADDVIEYLKLDFFYGLKWRGFNFLSAEQILSSRVPCKNYFIPDSGHEAAIHLLNGILYSRSIKNKYLRIIDDYHTRDSFKDILSYSGMSFLVDKVGSVIGSAADSDLIDVIYKLRIIVVRKLRMKIMSPKVILSCLKSIKTELITRRGMGQLISFSGPDGSGKSSIMEFVLEFFKLSGITGQNSAHHFLPAGIPPLHRLFKVNKKLSMQDYTKPYSEKSVGSVQSLVRFVYYALAFFIAKKKYIEVQKRRNEVVVFDRYYPDIIADPSRARLSINRKVISTIFKFCASIPQVALVFVASPEILVRRKGELSPKKATQLVEHYREICRGTDFILIENDGSLEDGAGACFAIIFERLHNENSRTLCR